MAARSILRTAALVAVAALGLACGSSPSPAAPASRCDRYAAPGGSDRAPGTRKRPVRTVQRLADRLRPGQTGCLRPGLYDQEVSGPYVLRPRRGGEPGRPMRIRSVPGRRARLRGVVYFPPGSGRFVLSHVDVDGRRPTGTDRPVSVQVLADRVTIARARITNAGTRTCVILGLHWATAERTVIRDSRFRDCGDPANGLFDHAVYASHSVGARIVRNTFVRSAGWAVQLYPDAQGTRVHDNVMWRGGGGVVFGGEDDDASSGNVVEGNVIGRSRARPEVSASWGARVGSGNVARGNCLVPGAAPFDDEREGYSSAGNRIAGSAGASACRRVVATATASRAAAVDG